MNDDNFIPKYAYVEENKRLKEKLAALEKRVEALESQQKPASHHPFITKNTTIHGEESPPNARKTWVERVKYVVKESGFTIQNLQHHFDKHVREEPKTPWYHSTLNMVALLLCANNCEYDVFNDSVDYGKMLERFDVYDKKMRETRPKESPPNTLDIPKRDPATRETAGGEGVIRDGKGGSILTVGNAIEKLNEEIAEQKAREKKQREEEQHDE